MRPLSTVYVVLTDEDNQRLSGQECNTYPIPENGDPTVATAAQKLYARRRLNAFLETNPPPNKSRHDITVLHPIIVEGDKIKVAIRRWERQHGAESAHLSPSAKRSLGRPSLSEEHETALRWFDDAIEAADALLTPSDECAAHDGQDEDTSYTTHLLCWLQEMAPLVANFFDRTEGGVILAANEDELALFDDLEEEDLVKNMIKLDTNGVIGAPEKGGKSWLALELAAAVSTGTPFLNDPRFEVPERKRVMLLFPEGQGAFRKRMNMLFTARADRGTFTVNSKFIVPVLELLDLTHEIGLKRFGATIAHYQPDLVIIDSAYAYFGSANGSDLYSMGKVLSNVHREVRANALNPCALWVSTHYKKAVNEADINSIHGVGYAQWANDWLLVERKSRMGKKPLVLDLEIGGRDRDGEVIDLSVKFEDGRWDTIDMNAALPAHTGEDDTTRKAAGLIVAKLREANHPLTSTEAQDINGVGTESKRAAWKALKEQGVVTSERRGEWVLADA